MSSITVCKGVAMIICIIFTVFNIAWYNSSSAPISQVLKFYISSLSSSSQVLKVPGIEHEQDWRPDQQLIDNWKNSAPFAHCPRGSNRKPAFMGILNNLVAANSHSFCTCPADVTFFIITNLGGDKAPVSEQLYQLCGCRYVHIRLNTTVWPGWKWIYKVTPLIQWLEEHGSTLPENSYIMYSDAFDTGLMGDASDIVTRFKEYDCELLGISTGADWPPSKEFRLFEKEKYPWSKCRTYLSAGAWMAHADDALYYLKLWEDDWRNEGSTDLWNDQMAFRRLHKRFYPKFKVDTLARVWTRCDSDMDCI